MRSITNIIGVLLIVFGLAALGYQGFSYTKQERLAQVGDVQVTQNAHKVIYIPPIFSSLCLIAGIVLILIKKSS